MNHTEAEMKAAIKQMDRSTQPRTMSFNYSAAKERYEGRVEVLVENKKRVVKATSTHPCPIISILAAMIKAECVFGENKVRFQNAKGDEVSLTDVLKKLDLAT